METTTEAPGLLEKSIRDRAVEDLKKRIEKTFEPIRSMCSSTPNGWVKVPVQGLEIKVESYALIAAMKDAVLAALTRRVGDEAVAEFITKVNDLDTRIQELRDGIDERY